MCTHIAKALQTCCKAIRNAVKKYNAAALKMTLPKPTVDWLQVSHYLFLEQFELLQNTWQDLANMGRWTEAEVQEVMKQDQCIKCTQEELVCCNVEIRHV